MLDASKGTVAVENGQSQISRSAREDEMNGASRTNRDLVGTDGSAKDTADLNDSTTSLTERPEPWFCSASRTRRCCRQVSCVSFNDAGIIATTLLLWHWISLWEIAR